MLCVASRKLISIEFVMYLKCLSCMVNVLHNAEMKFSIVYVTPVNKLNMVRNNT